ncbi:MAG TPA: carboxymuconolactone decarboxylase family protein [Blastocatellia bacterium]
MIKYVKPITRAPATGPLKEIYNQIRRDFGLLAEPFTLHSSVPELLAAVWAVCRESQVTGIVPRQLKEIVAITVSKLNRCPWCVDAHTIMLAATDHGLAAAIENNDFINMGDERITTIIQWAASTRSPGAQILRAPPFSPQEAPEIISTAIFYHYMNRMVTVLLNETPLGATPILLRGLVKRISSHIFRPAIVLSKAPGESLKFLSKAEMPADLKWAEPNEYIAYALASLASAVEDGMSSALSEKALDYTRQYIGSWDGDDPGMSRKWVEQAIETFDDENRAAVRLILLTALAPYQVNDVIIKDYLSARPDPVRLLKILAWASFTAARRIGAWICIPLLKRTGATE